MTGFSVSDWVSLLEKADFAQATIGTGGSNILSNDVPEDRIFIPLAFIFSDTSGSDNTLDIDKVEEDDTTTQYHHNFNIGADSTVIVTLEELAPLVPRLEGDTNLQFTANSASVEVTMVYVPNVEV